MNEKTGSSLCPKCGAVIPAEASQGLCPKCALAAVAALTETGGGSPWPAGVPSLEAVQAAFPQFEIIELIGAGGMGAVFKARQPKLDRFVALKVLSPSLAASPAFAERFNREARVLARLSHPGIVNVFDFGVVEPPSSGSAVVQASSLLSGSGTSTNAATPLYFLLMEYVDGVNLRQAMAAGRFTPGQALALVPKICEALQFAHDEGILHRDIKPENILLDTRGRLKIADFGIAKLVGEPTAQTRLTATGAAVGTPQYMAPEQLERPGDVDQRADIYSLGVVFYEMLTGELPIGRFAPPSAKAPVDPRVDEVVFRALEKERERRYGSAGEVKTSVEHLTQAPVASPVATTPAFDPAKDFILCPPQLPRMAQAIIVYALVVAPMLWVLDLFVLAPLPDHPAVGFAQAMVNLFSSVGLFLLLVLLWIGGWKLRGLRRSAVTWLKTAIWLRFAGGLLAGLGQVWVEVLAAQLLPDEPSTRPPLSEGFYIAMSLAALGFEISALVWLHRHTALLRSVCLLPSVGGPERGTPTLDRAGAVGARADRGPRGLRRRYGAVGLVVGIVLLGWLGLTLVKQQRGQPVIARSVATLRPYPNQAPPLSPEAFNGLVEVPAGHLLRLQARLSSNNVPVPAPGLSAHILAPRNRPHRDLLAWRILAVGEPGNRGAGWNLSLGGGTNPVLYPPAQGAERPDWRLVELPSAVNIPVGSSQRVPMLRGSGLAADGSPVRWEATLEFELAQLGGDGYQNEASLVGTGFEPAVRVEVLAGDPDRMMTVKALTPPRENLIVSATVFSNNVPVSGRALRAKLWPASSLKPSPYTIRWQALAEPAAAPWEVAVIESWTGTIAARLRPEGLPLLDWMAAPQAAKATVKQVSREAQAFEIARALQDVGGGNGGAADWSVRLQLQSQPPQPSTSQRGIEADFVLPADQVAVFEVVTRTNRQVISVPGLAAYLVNGASESCEGTFLWHDDPEDLDSLTALPRWSFGLVVDGGRSVATGLGVPTPPPNYAGSVSLWTQLEPDTERIEGLSESDAGPAQPPTYGLRVRTQTFRSKPGLKYQGAGFGTNWLAEATTRMAAPAP